MPRRRELLLLALGIVLALLVAEGAVRLLSVGPSASGYAPIRTSREMGPFNSHGYRDWERAVTKPTGVRRIVSIGDSFAWGWGILFDDTYAQRVERTLSHRRQGQDPWEVVSLASPGYNTVQEWETLSTEGVAYDPDIVVLGYVLNDSADENAPEAKRAEDWARDALAAPSGAGRFLGHSALYTLVRSRIHATAENRRRVEAMRAAYGPDYPGWIAGRKALREMGVVCRQQGVPLVVLIFPDLASPLDGRYPFEGIHREVASVAGAAGAKVVDLLPFYRGLKWDLLVVDGANDAHPNEIAHRIAAIALLNALGELVPPPATAPSEGEGLGPVGLR